MRLKFRQRFFSWFDSYDICDEFDTPVYSVQGQLSWGHRLVIYDSCGRELGMVSQKVLTLLPKFEFYENGRYLGQMTKEFSFFSPHYNIDFNGWHADGSFTEWDYTIRDPAGNTVAEIGKEIFHMTDTYIIDVAAPRDALYVLMFVLAIDAEKCSRDD